MALAESRKIHLINLVEAKKARVTDFSSDGFVRDGLERIGEPLKDISIIPQLNRHLSTSKKPLDHDIIAIAVVDKGGKVVASNVASIINKDVSSWEEFVQSISKGFGEAYVGQPQYTPYLDKNTLNISAPIISRATAETIGIIVNAYDLAVFNEITAQRVGLGETGEVYLLNRDKIMFTGSRFLKDTVLKQVVDTAPVRKLANGYKEIVGIYPDYRGIPVIGAAVYIPECDWTLLVEIDKAEAFKPLEKVSIILLIVGACSIGLFAGVGIVFARNLSKPIEMLRNVTKEFAMGNLEKRIETTRKDEIGLLCRSFNKMAEEILSGRSWLLNVKTMVLKLAELAEKRDPETGLHLARVSEYSSILARELTRSEKYKEVIDENFVQKIGDFSPLHDIGKVGISDSILLKPGPLTDEERATMVSHTTIGGAILYGVEHLNMGKEIALYHHERWDGKGYPLELSGEEIPIAARIVALADTFDALTRKRPYKNAMSVKESIKIINDEKGKAFDPDIVDAFLKKLTDFIIIQAKYKGP